MGNLSSSPFPKKRQPSKAKPKQPEIGGDEPVVTPVVDLTPEQADEFLKQIAALKQEIEDTQKKPASGGKSTNQRKLRIKFV